VAHGELADELATHGLHPLTSLFGSRTKSMYVPLGAQEATWWLLLRATLSGMTVVEADQTAELLLKSEAEAPEVTRNAVMLCVLMHTQTAMRIVAYGPSDANSKWPENFPLAAMIRWAVDPVCRQTALDILATTTSGTLDLESLASDDLGFNHAARPRVAHAWMRCLKACCYDVETNAEPAPDDDDHVALTVQRFCDALKAIGVYWIDACLDENIACNANPNPGSPLVETNAASADEMRNAIMRAAAASASINCAQWLRVVFELSWRLEQRWREANGRPLIRSNLVNKELHLNVLKDEAWLRTHFCYLAEQALHSARIGGMWTVGNHLVLVARLSTDRRHTDVHKKDHGVRAFARAITSHTVRATEPYAEQAQLITPTWQRAVTRSGWDSIVECARLFERELHACTERLHTAHGNRATTVLPNSPPPPPTPVVHERSIDRKRVAAVACGPDRFEKDRIPALDEATDAALARWRACCNEVALHRTLHTCSSVFGHGACVEVISMRSNEDDVKYARYAERRGVLHSKWYKEGEGEEEVDLLARITRFSAVGVGS
jgi:hypothetical protein